MNKRENESDDDDVQFVAEKKHEPASAIELDESGDNDNDENDEDDDDSQRPSGAECLARCKQFASVTNTDNALAMFYLQENDWDVEKGLDAFYQSTQSVATTTTVGAKKPKVVACFDVEQLNRDEERIRREQEEQEHKAGAADDDDDDNSEQSKYFKILSWNIDGLDQNNLESRTKGVIALILKEKPDVIMLQEVIEESEGLLRDGLKRAYEFSISTKRCSYYTMIMHRKKTCSLMSTKTVIDFENTSMGRNLLMVKLIYKQTVKMAVMTAHLESTVAYAKQRMEQLKKCFKCVQEQDGDLVVLFGGDLNLRDSEITDGLPKGVIDVWQGTGSRKEAAFTWDCTRNTNLKMNGKFKPKCRFDRLYFRPTTTKNKSGSDKAQGQMTLMPVYFELDGLEKLKSCGRFCSDHWAIQSYFELQKIK